MEHESFEDAEVAKFMNDHFISIKVDREERPDIDQIYMDAIEKYRTEDATQTDWRLNFYQRAHLF